MVKRDRGGMARAAMVALALVAGGWQCGNDEPTTGLDTLVRFWSFHRFDDGEAGQTPIGAERVQVGGAVSEKVDLGGVVLHPPWATPDAEAEVFSNDTGATYWVSAQAPASVLGQGAPIGSTAELAQYQYFRKTAADATLKIVVSKVFLDSIDANGGMPTALECPWHRPGRSYGDCRRTMWAWATFGLSAFDFRTQTTFLRTGGFVELFGWQGNWGYDAYTTGDATRPLWNPFSFEVVTSDDDDGGVTAGVSLLEPITVDVPLSSIQVGDMFYVLATAEASTVNHRQRESYLSSYLRDPQESDGMSLRFEGLEPLETPTELPALAGPEPAPACAAGPDPEAGTIELAADAFADPELPGEGSTVVVTRAGGSVGAVSAHLATSDGSALAGADYTAVDTEVLFADGEEGSRAVRIPIATDAEAEPDKTLTVTLSAPGGCAALGATTSAEVTIQDDDRPLDLPGFTVGGTVSGLEGTGLVLSEATTGRELTPENGDFAFDYQFPNGTDYEVRVASQPVDPIQVCTAARASGTIADADVTDVAITCVTPAVGEGLDPSFGGGGRVTTGLPGGAAAMALQADGKIVVVGGLRMARYDTDGGLDASFGTGGVVDLVFSGGLLDEGLGVSIQPNGRILVVGVTTVGAQDDFAVNRYLASGALDTSFGGDGKVNTDFSGSGDSAYAVLVQPDGRIVVAGHAATPTPLGVDSDFAVARYTSAGVLDGGFGTDGRVTIDIGGRTDLAYAAALQPDGRILVAGRVADGGGDNPDIGLVRLAADDGAPDGSFGVQGIVRTDFGDWDEATGIALQSDGRIVVSTNTVVGASFLVAVARYGTGGALELGFGDGGLATATFSGANDVARAVAVQPDGRIVVAGQSSNLAAPDFAIARFDTSGALDGSFDGDGMLTVDFFGASDGAQCLALQPDGKIIGAGFARNGTATGLGMVRLLPGS